MIRWAAIRLPLLLRGRLCTGETDHATRLGAAPGICLWLPRLGPGGARWLPAAHAAGLDESPPVRAAKWVAEQAPSAEAFAAEPTFSGPSAAATSCPPTAEEAV